MFSSRILRRRWVLAVIFGFSLVYFIINIYKQTEDAPLEHEPKHTRLPSEPFKWNKPQVERGNDTKLHTCRNSVQGRHLIADERGFVCERRNLLVGGCCRTGGRTKRFVCDSCMNTGCCSIYEHCVSCCLQPEKQPLLRKILSKAADTFHHLFASVTDPFELCLAKCRTSSQSVQHENSYRDPRAKYCYGESPPDLQPVIT